MEHSEQIIDRKRKIEYSISDTESFSPKSIEEPFSPSASEYVPSTSSSSESECGSPNIPMLPQIKWSAHHSENEEKEDKKEKIKSKNKEEKTPKGNKKGKMTTQIESSEKIINRQMAMKYVVSEGSFSPKCILFLF